TMFSGKPAAWSWLNWSALQGPADIIFKQVYPKLFSRQDDAQREAIFLAGLCNVKYLVDDKTEPPNVEQVDDKLLQPIHHQGRFVVYENKLCQPFIQIYPQAAAYVGQFDDQAAKLMAYCAANNTAFYEIEPDALPRIDWNNYRAVFWN